MRCEALECPLEHRLGLLALELDRQLAGLELVEQLRAHSASSRTRPLRARARRRAPSSSSLEPARERGERLVLPARPSSQPWMSPATAASSSSLGTRRNSGLADLRVRRRGRRARRCRTPGRACRRRRAPSCPGSRGRRSSAARTRAGSRRGAGRAALIASPKRASRCSISRPEALLRLGHREVAVRLAGAADRAAAHVVDVEREADLRELGDDAGDALVRARWRR